jgi:hypothetical protein
LVVHHSLLLITGEVFKLAIYVQGLVLFYLGYWIFKVFQEE